VDSLKLHRTFEVGDVGLACTPQQTADWRPLGARSPIRAFTVVYVLCPQRASENSTGCGELLYVSLLSIRSTLEYSLVGRGSTLRR
jgi:hypothetical protein